MGRRQYLWIPLRVALLSLIGAVQFMLVAFGCVHVSDLLQESFPPARHLAAAGPLIGFLTLVYPVYIWAAMNKAGRKV